MNKQRKQHIIDFGGAGEVVVLLHGFLASSKYWSKLQPHLTAAGYRVIAIDLLGFGAAPKPHSATYDYDEHVRYIHTVINQHGIFEPCIVIGHSMGALIAARYEKLFPSRVRSLVLLHPPLYTSLDQARTTLRNTSRIYRFLLDSKFRRLGWVMMKTVALHRISKHSQRSRELSLRNVIEKAEAFDDLRSTMTNTLLIVGRRDRAEYIANLASAQLSRSITVQYEDVSHHSPLDAPDLIQARIRQFIR